MKYYLLVSFMAFFLAGCNTVHGVGEDVQSGGEAISDSANDMSRK